MIKRKTVCTVLFAVLMMLFSFPAFAETPKEADAPLSEYWNAESMCAEYMRNYVAKVTDESDPENFIPVKDRIAVFDMDGTLTCETFYTYYDTMMFIDYCATRLDDNEYLSESDKEELKQVAKSITPDYKAGEELARNFARAYTGMTVQRPMLAFGNSSGDFSMLNYAEGNLDHTGMGFLVVCDDTVREYGNDEKAADYYAEAAKEGWTAISMANDWATIYGEGVRRTELPGVMEEPLAIAA